MTTPLLSRQGHKRQLAIVLKFQKPLFDTTWSRTLKNRRHQLFFTSTGKSGDFIPYDFGTETYCKYLKRSAIGVLFLTGQWTRVF
jgi:hypothetical protein